MEKNKLEKFIEELNEDKPKMEWHKIMIGRFEYLCIEGCPEGVYFIKHGIRRTYAMHKGEWREVSVYLLLYELMLRFEDLWKKKKINFDNYREKKKEKNNEIIGPPDFDGEE